MSLVIVKVTDPCFVVDKTSMCVHAKCNNKSMKRDEEHNNMYMSRPLAYNFPFDIEFFQRKIFTTSFVEINISLN